MVMVKIEENEERLLRAALNAMKHAYVLWGCRVGAAVLAEDGQIYEGCNVESWVSGLGTCAERCAINHAVLHGNRGIKEVAMVMEAHKQSQPLPCGACLQHIHDFAVNPKIKIIMANGEAKKIFFQTIKVKTLDQLLPFPYKT